MRVLDKIIRAGFTVNLNDKGKLCFTFEGDKTDRPPTFRIAEMIKNIRENRETAIIELKQMKSGEILDGLLPRSIRRTNVDDHGDN